ncbi:sensor histidine kinase [Streptacidiphilus sp. EB129]|uniref:sensor histidine kinase n=1 Tax=Streptacidiphilus sp. EB129 TaxID=3156262 RepID=UPI003516B5D1
MDLLVAGLVAGVALSGHVHDGAWLPGWLVWPAAAGQALPLLVRRRMASAVVPAVLLTAGLAGACAAAAGVPAGACVPGLLAACYAAATYGRPPRDVAALVLTLMAALSIVLLGRGQSAEPVSAAAVLLSVALAWLAGYALRTRRAYIAGLVERAERLEREEGERAARAVVEERLRIARELHDAVGHSVSVIAIQSEAASRTLAGDPAAVAEYLQVIGTASRAAMAELRQVLRVLRPQEETDAEWDPAPGLGRLDDLVAGVEAAGVPVRLRTRGDLTDLPLGPGLVAFRIVQESLTNVLRHAGVGASAEVTVLREPTMLRVAVTDDGGGGPSAEAVGSGHSGHSGHSGQGMVGMRERVAVYGGTFRAGPGGRGFVVAADIPLQEQPEGG